MREVPVLKVYKLVLELYHHTAQAKLILEDSSRISAHVHKGTRFELAKTQVM